MPIPNYNQIAPKGDFTVKREDGSTLNIRVFDKIRGTGKRKWCLTVNGFCTEPTTTQEQFSVEFDGGERYGTFSKCEPSGKPGVFRVTFETIISHEPFWE